MKKVIVIVGPTGVGKTKLSIELAKKYNGEIINGDSMQVYKEMNIGTAKIKDEEKEGIPHHLFSILSFNESNSIYEFQTLVRNKIEEISSRNKLPIIVGGTGLYLKACLYDYEFLETKESNANLDKYYIWSIEGLKFVSKEQLLSFSLFSENTQFVSGYNAGYNTGFNEGVMSNDSYTVGYDDGYNLGYSVGNRSGYIEGLQGAENSNFYQLITAVIDVPLNAFVSMFNFDVLGINMANFFLSLLTLCVVLTVVRMLI